jgi:YgiT-type zinc finger domain-containing protein
MGTEVLDTGWREVAAEALSGMSEWRQQHPQATLREIEAAVDEHLATLRARMVEDAALASRVTDLRAVPVAERPACPECGTTLVADGSKTRTLTTTRNRRITLRRSHAVCPACGAGLFPPRWGVGPRPGAVDAVCAREFGALGCLDALPAGH